MSGSLVSTFAQGSTVGGFLLNVAAIGHNAVFHRTTEIPTHLKSAQSFIQKIRDDIRNFSAYLSQKEMDVYKNKCNKLCDKVEKLLEEYYQMHIIKRYYMTSENAITTALELDRQCRKLHYVVWNASTGAKAKMERERGLNFVEKSHEVVSDREPALDDSGLEALKNEVNLESPSESPSTDSKPQDHSPSESLLTAVHSVLPPFIRVTPPGTGGRLMSLPNFLRTIPLLTTRNTTPTGVPGIAFEMTTLNRNSRSQITSTPDEGASE